MWLVTSSKETILHNGKNTFHDITLYTHVHAILVQTLRLHRYEKCSQHEICKYSVSTITLMDGNCVKHKLYGRWKTQFARKHRLYGGQTDTNTFIEARVPVRPLYPSVHFPDHPLPHHLDHLHPHRYHPASCLFLVLSFLPKSYSYLLAAFVYCNPHPLM